MMVFILIFSRHKCFREKGGWFDSLNHKVLKSTSFTIDLKDFWINLISIILEIHLYFFLSAFSFSQTCEMGHWFLFYEKFTSQHVFFFSFLSRTSMKLSLFYILHHGKNLSSMNWREYLSSTLPRPFPQTIRP